jgi:hypothetical protein
MNIHYFVTVDIVQFTMSMNFLGIITGFGFTTRAKKYQSSLL